MTIIILIENIRQWDFFSRFFSALNHLGKRFIIVTPLFSVHFMASFYTRSYLVYGAGKSGEYSYFDVASGRLSKSSSIKLVSATLSTLNNVFSKGNEEGCIWLWNGLTSMGVAAQLFSSSGNFSIKYFELSNVPGKIFVDSFGVNNSSSVFLNVEVLRRKDLVSSFRSWRVKYIESKLAAVSIGQAARRKKINWIQLLDIPIFFLRGGIFPDRVSLKTALRLDKVSRNYSVDVDVDKIDYIFLPLQVSNDSQLIVNSQIDNFEAIDQALRIADSFGCQLVVKLHPAEISSSFVKEVVDYSFSHNFILTNINTFRLIGSSRKVVVINSTVGLEALILGVDVIFLAECLYQKLVDEELLAGYVMSYLFPVDPFADDDVNVDLVERLIS